jgi:hypothetical protein
MMVSTYDEEAVAVFVVEKDVESGTSFLAAACARDRRRRPAPHQGADGQLGCDDVRWRPSPRQLRQRRPGRRATA